LKRVDIVYEDEYCLILNKPAGLAVQGGRGVEVSLDRLLAEEYSPPPLLVHRLDKDTSGLILVAKTKEAAADFSRIFAEGVPGGGEGRGIIKQYLAVCAGRPEVDSGLISLDLEIKGSVKKSETRFKVLKGGKDFSLLELELGTGRMHQIRRHLALTGNPVLGDDKYGDFRLNKELRREKGLKRLLLHAARLRIPGIGAQTPLDLEAPLPDYFKNFLDFCY
jgi:23S rRNA pseudouridine955/2504/2580 synthase